MDRSVAGSWIYPDREGYEVREYQRSIAETCLKKNTLVSLPTGLGKTLIAAVVIYNYHRWFPNGKIIFMAPTRPLVTQQIASCRNIMCLPEEALARMEGTVSVSLRQKLWKEKSIFFCTPQVVENDLYSGSCLASDIVCMIVDEAHRASSSNYAYSKVVRLLDDQPLRIVGLSATPGTDLKSIQNVVRHLKISHIEYRSEDSPDILKFSHDKAVEVVKCSPGNIGASSLSSSKIMSYLDDLIQQVGTILQRNNLIVSSKPSNINKFILNEAERSCCDSDIFGSDRQNTLMAIKLAQYLVDAKLILTNSGSAKLWRHLQERNTSLSNVERLVFEHPSYDAMVRLLRTMDSSVASHHVRHVRSAAAKHLGAKIEKLMEILCDHINSKDKSKAIVFVNLRSTVQEIVTELSHCDGLRVNQFIGQGTSKSSTQELNLGGGHSGKVQGRGQSQQEQQAVIEAFNSGIYNVLVATSIAEEGLDIEEVDLIVSFDVVVSPVRMLQRMGRTGRKKPGRAVMLVMEGNEVDKVHRSSDMIGHVNELYKCSLDSLAYYQNSPRMISGDLEPVMVLQNMQDNCPAAANTCKLTHCTFDPDSLVLPTTSLSHAKEKWLSTSKSSLFSDRTSPWSGENITVASSREVDKSPCSSFHGKVISHENKPHVTSATSEINYDSFCSVKRMTDMNKEVSSRFSPMEYSNENRMNYSEAGDCFQPLSPFKKRECEANSKSSSSIYAAKDGALSGNGAGSLETKVTWELMFNPTYLRCRTQHHAAESVPHKHVGVKCTDGERRSHFEIFDTIYSSDESDNISDNECSDAIIRDDNIKCTASDHLKPIQHGNNFAPTKAGSHFDVCDTIFSTDDDDEEEENDDVDVKWNCENSPNNSIHNSNDIQENILFSLSGGRNLYSTGGGGDSAVQNSLAVGMGIFDDGGKVSASNKCYSGKDILSERNNTRSATPGSLQPVMQKKLPPGVIRSKKLKKKVDSSPDEIKLVRQTCDSIFSDLNELSDIDYEEDFDMFNIPQKSSTFQEAILSPVNSVSNVDKKSKLTHQSQDSTEVIDETPCAVCTESDTRNGEDPGVFCDGDCACFQHLECCGLREVPSSSKYFCESCDAMQNSVLPRSRIICELCKNTDGTLRRSECGKWVHTICVIFTPELALNHNNRRRARLCDLDPDRHTLKCCVCKGIGGSNIQCAYGDCLASFHPFCAFLARKQMIRRMDEEGYCYSEIYCNVHKFKVLEGSILSSTTPIPGRKARPYYEILNTPSRAVTFADEDDLVDSVAKSVRALPRRRLRQSKNVGDEKCQVKRKIRKRRKCNPFIDDEAVVSGSDSGDECNSLLEGELSDSFINDGEYTQAASPGRGNFDSMAFYHGLHRELDMTPARAGVKYRFRGGERKMPITEKIMREMEEHSPCSSGIINSRNESINNSHEEDSALIAAASVSSSPGAIHFSSPDILNDSSSFIL